MMDIKNSDIESIRRDLDRLRTLLTGNMPPSPFYDDIRKRIYDIDLALFDLMIDND